jgi:hypothetical protein
MSDIYFKEISHLSAVEQNVCDTVELITTGEKYSCSFGQVEEEVAEKDICNGFFDSSYFPTYKAKEDRWNYDNVFVGSQEFIEKQTKYQLKYINGVWYRMPHLVIRFLDQTEKTIYFNTNDEMNNYITFNFKEYKKLSKPNKININ